MEETQDSFNARIDERIEHLLSTAEKHEKRIQWLEKIQWMILGALVLIQYLKG